MFMLLKTTGKLLNIALTLLCKLMHSKIYHSKLNNKMEQKARQVLEKSFGSGFIITWAKIWDFAVYSPKITHSSATALAGGHRPSTQPFPTQLSRPDLGRWAFKAPGRDTTPFPFVELQWRGAPFLPLKSQHVLLCWLSTYLISLVLLTRMEFMRNVQCSSVALSICSSYSVCSKRACFK